MSTIFSENLFVTFEQQFRPYIDKLGIPSSVFSKQDVEIEGFKYLELLETVARNGNPYIGLDMGEQLTVEDVGVLGYAMAASTNIKEALGILSRYIYVFSHSNTFRIHIGENNVVCTYNVEILQPNQYRQDVEFALAYVTHAIRRLSQKEFRPTLVEFVHIPFEKTIRHKSFFNCNVKFEQRANRLHFDKNILSAPVVSRNTSLLKALKFYLDDRMKVRSEDQNLISKVNHLISASLSSEVLCLQKVASQLGMGSRSLQRKLRKNNVVFSELVSSTRNSIALDYIRNTEVNFTNVALMLGYGELSSFSRAFKRLYGLSPKQVRELNEIDYGGLIQKYETENIADSS